MKTILVAFLTLAATVSLSAQATVWSFPKAGLFGPDALGLDIQGGDQIDLDGNPATVEFVVYAFSGYWQGFFSTVALRGGRYCRSQWFYPWDTTQFAWSRLEKHGGLTRLVIQETPAETIRAVALPLPVCP